MPLAVGGALYAAAVAWALPRLPAEGVPLHFGPRGVADELGSRDQAVVAMVLTGAGLLALGTVLVLLARRAPLGAVNVPHRSYWVAEQRRPVLRGMLAVDVAVLIGVTLAFLVLFPVSTALAVASPDRALPPLAFWGPTAVYAVGLLAWVGWLVRFRYRPPPGDAAD